MSVMMTDDLMDCFSAGSTATASLLTGKRSMPLFEEVVAYHSLWIREIGLMPTDEMTAAWLIGLSKSLASLFPMVEISSKERKTVN